MIYRNKSLAEMNKIGLVQLLGQPQATYPGKAVVKVNDSRIIEQSYRKESIEYLTKPEHHNFFSHLSLMKKAKNYQQSINKAIKILKSI